MRIALCNEVIGHLDFAAQCDFAAALGYDALEIAPYTLGETPHRLDAGTIGRVRRNLADAGLEAVGLHWLLVRPEGLSITSRDRAVHAQTVEVMVGLVGLCAELGGTVLVHGSPAQRKVADAGDAETAWARARDAFASAAEAARSAGVTYCLEPLSPPEADFVTSIAEAARMVGEIESPAFRTMIDTKAAAKSEAEPPAALIRRWYPTGLIAHIQVNDRNRRGPGEGADRFTDVFRALKEVGHDGYVSVEPFVYVPDGAAVAARAIGYVRGILEALEEEDGAVSTG